jgi:hypothetical protein
MWVLWTYADPAEPPDFRKRFSMRPHRGVSGYMKRRERSCPEIIREEENGFFAALGLDSQHAAVARVAPGGDRAAGPVWSGTAHVYWLSTWPNSSHARRGGGSSNDVAPASWRPRLAAGHGASSGQPGCSVGDTDTGRRAAVPRKPGAAVTSSTFSSSISKSSLWCCGSAPNVQAASTALQSRRGTDSPLHGSSARCVAFPGRRPKPVLSPRISRLQPGRMATSVHP